MKKIGLSGSCHWCTEAIFKSLKGVLEVQQGWLASTGIESSLSEGILITYDPVMISLETLVSIHLYTHSSSSSHSMRTKYRSAVYTFSGEDNILATKIIGNMQKDFDLPIITKVLPFNNFKINNEEYLDYYFKNPEKPFCQNYIDPKLKVLLKMFSHQVDNERLSHLQ